MSNFILEMDFKMYLTFQLESQNIALTFVNNMELKK
jgi:hypothetical protein